MRTILVFVAVLAILGIRAFAAPALKPNVGIGYVFDVNHQTKFPHYWEKCVGSGHAALALREDYRKQMNDSQANLGWEYVRFHGIFDDDMSVVLDENNFSFYDVDNLYDYLLSIDMRPIVELRYCTYFTVKFSLHLCCSFQPSAFASNDNTVFYYKGNISPPKNYTQWAGLVSSFAQHMVARYGLAEVQQWYFEVWNEPNCGFWNATLEEYWHLLQVTVDAVHSVHPTLRVGGPATCQSAYIAETMAFCRANNVRLDFVSTHEYPTDPYDESHRNSIMPEVMARTKQLAGGLPVLYTEYNSGLLSDVGYPMPNHDLPFAAAFIVRNIYDCAGLST